MSNLALKTTHFLLLFSCAAIVTAQNTFYQTIKVRGVTLSHNHRPLQNGQKFKKNNALTFGSTKDFVVVMDEKKACFTLQPDGSLRQYVAKSLSVPIDTRRGDILNDLQLRWFLRQHDSLLLLNGRFSLVLGQEAFPMDDNHFFYLEYRWKGNTIPKKLGFRKDTLFIDAKELYKVDEKPIDPVEVGEQYFIRYYDAKTNSSVGYPDAVQPIYIIRPNEEELKKEVQVLLKASQGKDIKTRTLQIDDYLKRFYGTAGDWELARLIKKLDK